MKKWTIFLILFLFGCSPLVTLSHSVKAEKDLALQVHKANAAWYKSSSKECLEKALVIKDKDGIESGIHSYELCIEPVEDRVREIGGLILDIQGDTNGIAREALLEGADLKDLDLQVQMNINKLKTIQEKMNGNS